ncbi:unnamed protein product [Ilex paraguariensis]|uniref:Uncharacterized protein n=1 Tax=Ilex paraguariensis TaxID=185542 RepID=A0ABC8S8K8_9AQUA
MDTLRMGHLGCYVVRVSIGQHLLTQARSGDKKDHQFIDVDMAALQASSLLFASSGSLSSRCHRGTIAATIKPPRLQTSTLHLPIPKLSTGGLAEEMELRSITVTTIRNTPTSSAEINTTTTRPEPEANDSDPR